jgi:hypothetical protein
MESEAEDLLDITVNGETVTITRNHPVLTVRGDNNEWIPAGELTLDDLVAVIPLQIHKIKSIKPSSYKGLVKNIEVEEDNSYVVQNIIVHNCKDISVAGKQKGLEDDRGKLMIYFIKRRSSRSSSC